MNADDVAAIRDAPLDKDELRELRTAADCAGLSQEFARLLQALEDAQRDAKRLQQICVNAHDRLLRGDDDRAAATRRAIVRAAASMVPA